MEIIDILKNIKLKNYLIFSLLGLTASYFFPSLNGYPIWFKEPDFICKNQTNNNSSFSCEESLFCSSKYITYEIEKTSLRSITREFSLFCQKKSQQRKSMSIILSGSFIGAIFNSLIPLKPKHKKSFILLNIFTLILALFLTNFFKNLIIISILLGFCNLCYPGVMGNIMPLAIELLPDELVKYTPAFVTFFFGLGGCFYILYSYLVINGNWRILLTTWGIYGLIICFLYKYIHPKVKIQKNFEENVI